jgi:predicted metal-dependent hydrolase
MIQVNNWSIPMKTVKDYADWFIEHDKHLTEVHLIIERDALKKELQNLEDEWDKMRKHLHQVEALIEKQQELNAALPETSEGGKSNVDRFENETC